MKIIFYMVITLLITVGTVNAFLWGPPVHITGLYVYGAGGAFITTDNNQNPDSCPNNNYLAIDDTAPNFRALYATILTANTTGSTVSINYNGCLGGYPLVNSAAIPNSW